MKKLISIEISSPNCGFCHSPCFFNKDYNYQCNCDQQIEHFTYNNKLGCLLNTIHKDSSIYYLYHFDTLTFSFLSYHPTTKKVFDNIKISSPKEFRSFGDRIQKLLIFS